MKKLLTGFLVMTFVVTAFVGMTYAHGPQGKYGAEYNQDSRNFGSGYSQVEMTESQIDKMSEYRAEFYNESEEIRDQLRELNWELRDLYMKNATNEEIGRVKDEIQVLAEEMNEMRIENQEKIQSILTDEQLQMIEENSANFQNRFDDDRFGRFNRDSQFGPGMMDGRSGYRSFQGRDFDQGYGMRSGMMGNRFNQNFDGFSGYGPGFCY
jgi:Spy/CpxP family protein refolding chaperone